MTRLGRRQALLSVSPSLEHLRPELTSACVEAGFDTTGIGEDHYASVRVQVDLGGPVTLMQRDAVRAALTAIWRRVAHDRAAAGRQHGDVVVRFELEATTGRVAYEIGGLHWIDAVDSLNPADDLHAARRALRWTGETWLHIDQPRPHS